MKFCLAVGLFRETYTVRFGRIDYRWVTMLQNVGLTSVGGSIPVRTA